MTKTRLLSLFVALFFVVSLSPGAAKKSAEQLRVVEQTPYERVADHSIEHSTPSVEFKTYVRPQYNLENMVPIPPGTYTIGAAGTYPTLSAAVTDLQTNGVSGPGAVIFEFIDVSYSDTGVTIGGYPGQSVANPVIFRPATGVAAHILFTGAASDSTFGVRIVNGVGVTFDGSNSGGSDRSLTLESDTSLGVARTVVLIHSGSDNITLKNMILKGWRRLPTANGATVIVIDSTGASTFGGNDSILIHNNQLMRGFNGIFERGLSDAVRNTNLWITNNLIGGGSSPNTVDHLASHGINLVQFTSEILIHENDINGIKAESTTPIALAIRGSQVNVTVAKNKIHNIVVTGGVGSFAPAGILVGNIVTTATSLATFAVFYNNMLYDFHNFATGIGHGRAIRPFFYNPTGAVTGAFPAGLGVGSYVEFVNNTFNFDLAAGEGTPGTAWVFECNFYGGNNNAAHPDVLFYLNNICSSRRPVGEQSRQFLAITPEIGSNFALTSDNNLYYTFESAAFAQFPYPYPTGPASFVENLAGWQDSTGLDAASVEGDPLFASPTSAYINTAVGFISPADSMAASFPGVIDDDIDGNPRDPNKPDIGAHEFDVTYSLDEAQPTAFNVPLNGAILDPGATTTPQATFKNNGLNANTIPVRYEIRNSSNTLVYSDVSSTASLATGASETVTFATSGSLAAGLYTIWAISQLGGDQIPANDTLSGIIWVLGSVSSLPYTEDFEDPAPEAAGGAGWAPGMISGTINDWVIGTPAKTQLSSALSGTKAFVTKTTGTYTANQSSFVHSPVFDLSSATGDIRVEWFQNFEIEHGWDGAVFEMSVDGGANWSRVDSTLGSGATFNTTNSIGWYNTEEDTSTFIVAPMWSGTTTDYSGHFNGWTKASTRIAGIAGQSDVRFRWRFNADGFVNFEGWAIDDVTILEDAATVNVATSAGWDLLSNPVITPNDGVQQLYPESAFDYGFGFNSTTGYVQQSNMTNGRGYWVKLNNGGSVAVGGSVLSSALAPVATGWNMVGSVSFDVDVADVVEIPSGIVISDYFSYSGTYATATTIESGRGYWVKAGASGALLLQSTGPAPAPRQFASLYDHLSSIVITDNNGNAQTLYFGTDESLVNISEMPPLPPEGAFDARFVSGDAGYMVRTHTDRATRMDMPIAVQSSAYPLTISWTIAAENALEGRAYMLLDEFGSPLSQMAGSGSMQIENASQKRFGIGVSGGIDIPVEFALSQNYPNPFNPSTTIRFALPTESRVTVGIYNLLGQLVSTLVNDVREAGYHAIEWNGTGSTGQQLGSGVYFVKFHADGGQGQTFSDVRKIMMMK